MSILLISKDARLIGAVEAQLGRVRIEAEGPEAIDGVELLICRPADDTTELHESVTSIAVVDSRHAGHDALAGGYDEFVTAGDLSDLEELIKRASCRCSAQKMRLAQLVEFRASLEARDVLLQDFPALMYRSWVRDDGAFDNFFVSSNVEKVVGFEAEALQTTDFWINRVHPDDRSRVAREIADQFENTGGFHVEYRWRHANGEFRRIQDRGRRIEHPDGPQVTGVRRDRTRQLLLQDKLLQGAKLAALGHLAGGLAHDFNNALMVIKSHATFVRGSLDVASSSHADLAAITTAANRAAELTKQLLAFSGQQISQPVSTSIGETVDRLEPILQRILTKKVELRVRTRAQHAIVDPSQLEQVLVNLAAVIRDGEPQLVSLEVGRKEVRNHPILPDGAYGAVRVSSDQPCVPPEIARHAFDPFYGALGEGLGLGLAAAYGMARQNGGLIELEVDEARGTMFCVFLPEDPEASEVSDGGLELVRPLDSVTVLVVEDDPLIRKAIERTLVSECGRVLLAQNGGEALVLLERENVDIILTDVVMPLMSGPELADRIGVSHPDLPVVYMTGYADGQRAARLPEDAAVIQKPFDPDDVLSRLAQVLSLAAEA